MSFLCCCTANPKPKKEPNTQVKPKGLLETNHHKESIITEISNDTREMAIEKKNSKIKVVVVQDGPDQPEVGPNVQTPLQTEGMQFDVGSGKQITQQSQRLSTKVVDDQPIVKEEMILLDVDAHIEILNPVVQENGKAEELEKKTTKTESDRFIEGDSATDVNDDDVADNAANQIQNVSETKSKGGQKKSNSPYKIGDVAERRIAAENNLINLEVDDDEIGTVSQILAPGRKENLVQETKLQEFATSQIVGVRKGYNSNLFAKYDNNPGSVGETRMDVGSNRDAMGNKSEMDFDQVTMIVQATMNVGVDGSLLKINEENDEVEEIDPTSREPSFGSKSPQIVVTHTQELPLGTNLMSPTSKFHGSAFNDDIKSMRSRSMMSSRSKIRSKRSDISPTALIQKLEKKPSVFEVTAEDHPTIVENDEEQIIDIKERILVCMFDGAETDALKKHCELHFSKSSLTFTNKDESLLNPDEYDVIIINLFGIADEDIDDNEEYYKNYGPHGLVWLIQEEEEDLQEWIKDINPTAHFVEIGDEVEVEMNELKQAISWGQKNYLNKK